MSLKHVFDKNSVAGILMQLIIAYSLVIPGLSRTLLEKSTSLPQVQMINGTTLINIPQESTMLNKLTSELNPQHFAESVDLKKTLTEIMKFDKDDVPNDLVEKRQKLFENYNINQSLVVDGLRNWEINLSGKKLPVFPENIVTDCNHYLQICNN